MTLEMREEEVFPVSKGVFELSGKIIPAEKGVSRPARKRCV